MPKGTKVARCVDEMKAKVARPKGTGANPYAVCQAATGQSYATGKPARSKRSYTKGKKPRPKGK